MKRRSLSFGWLLLLVAAAQLLLFPQTAHAKYIGADPPRCTCCLCACAPSCSCPQMQESSDTSSTISRSEGNLIEQVNISRIMGGFGANIPFTAVYNSYNADGSRAQVDTMMGYGWTHSYNLFLFN